MQDACALYVLADGTAACVKGALRENAAVRTLVSKTTNEVVAFALCPQIVGSGPGWSAIRPMLEDAHTLSASELTAIVERALEQGGVKQHGPIEFAPVKGAALSFFESIRQRRDPRAQRACSLLWQKQRREDGDLRCAEAALMHASLVAQSASFGEAHARKRLKRSNANE